MGTVCGLWHVHVTQEPPPLPGQELSQEPPRHPLPAQESPPLPAQEPSQEPPRNPLRAQEPPPFCTGTPLPGPFVDPSWTLPAQEPPPLPAQERPFLDHFLSPFVAGTSGTSLQADVDLYPRLVLKSVDEEERAAPLPVAPLEATRTVDGRAPSLQDPPTWVFQSTLTITDMHSPVTRQGGTLWYRDCTLTARKRKAATTLQLRLPVACTDSLAELPEGHARHGKTYVVAEYLCLVGHAKASNTWSFLVYSEQTSFKTLKSLARLMGLDAGVPMEVHNAVDDWLEKYRKRQEQVQLGGRSHVKKEPGTEERTQPLWQQPGAKIKPEQLERAARGSVKRPAQRTVIPDSPSKRRVPGSPGRASPMAMDTGAVITQLAPGLQEVVRTVLKEVLPDAVEKAITSGSKTRAERATEQATKKERAAREEVVKHEATIASMQARLIALEDRLEAAEDVRREAQAGSVKAESLCGESCGM